jgi:hypothetical protein
MLTTCSPTSKLRLATSVNAKGTRSGMEESAFGRDLRPVKRVLDFAANYENDPQWRSEVRRMHYRTPGRAQKGN